MEDLSSKEKHGGIVNYFQGATIHNMVINGNMTKSGTEYYGDQNQTNNNGICATADDVAVAAKACSALIWGPAAMAVIYGVSRDIFHLQENATDFEKAMTLRQLNCPPGTIANTFRHNPYMKSHVSRWAALGAKSRVIKLMDMFQDVMNQSELEE